MNEIEQGELMNRIREELSSLAKFVDKTRKGIDALESTVKIGTEKFPEASTQLFAVTGDLENAANNIMSILEGLMSEHDRSHALLKELSDWAGGLTRADREKGAAIIKELDRLNEKAKREMMEIFSNMSFQDLTGQKLKKVITGLSAIESKVLELALSFGIKNGTISKDKKDILNELKNAGERPLKQDVVDMILKELRGVA